MFVIILILLSSVFVGASALLDKSKSRAAAAQLAVVESAIDEFKRNQTERPTIVLATQQVDKHYATRYGSYPPDELELFTPAGLPGSKPPPPNRSLVIERNEDTGERVSVVPKPTGANYDAMKFYTAGNPKPELEHRDLAAMLLAIEMFSSSAQAILDQLPPKQWHTELSPADGTPVQFLDMDGDGSFNAKKFDRQIRWLLDPWGVPLSYFAQRDWKEDDPEKTKSSNHESWNEASTKLIRLNGGRPIIMSFGPDGRDQLKKDILDNDLTASLVGDWATHGTLRNPLNEDNVYADPALAEKLAPKVSP